MTVTHAADEEMILDAVRKGLDRDMRSHLLRMDHADECPTEMDEQMKALGLVQYPHRQATDRAIPGMTRPRLTAPPA